MTKQYRQRGLSMVELLIALALSSFLILGITQIYLDNKSSYTFQLSQGNNQENTRYAEFILSGWINKAGYRRTPEQLVEDAFPALAASDDCESFAAGAVISAYKATAGSGQKGLCLRYQPTHPEERDCQGDKIKSITDTRLNIPFIQPSKDELVVSVIRFVPNNDLHKGVLECKNLTSSTPAFSEVIDGVADLHLEYAVGENDLFEKRVKANNPWTKTLSGDSLVRAVRYSVLLSSAPNRREGGSAILTRWNSEFASATDKTRIENNDKQRIYQLTSSVITVRNMMP